MSFLHTSVPMIFHGSFLKHFVSLAIGPIRMELKNARILR